MRRDSGTLMRKGKPMFSGRHKALWSGQCVFWHALQHTRSPMSPASATSPAGAQRELGRAGGVHLG